MGRCAGRDHAWRSFGQSRRRVAMRERDMGDGMLLWNKMALEMGSGPDDWEASERYVHSFETREAWADSLICLVRRVMLQCKVEFTSSLGEAQTLLRCACQYSQCRGGTNACCRM